MSEEEDFNKARISYIDHTRVRMYHFLRISTEPKKDRWLC